MLNVNNPNPFPEFGLMECLAKILDEKTYETVAVKLYAHRTEWVNGLCLRLASLVNLKMCIFNSMTRGRQSLRCCRKARLETPRKCQDLLCFSRYIFQPDQSASKDYLLG